VKGFPKGSLLLLSGSGCGKVTSPDGPQTSKTTGSSFIVNTATTNMKRILVPTDLSDTATLGLKLAVEIAKRCNATISLVNFTRHPLGKTFSSTGEVNIEGDVEETVHTLEYLQALKVKLEKQAAPYINEGLSFEVKVIDAKFKNGVDALTSEENIDLIVMGTSGEENAQEVFTGNHTQQVIRVSHAPVLSVRDGFELKEFENIVVAVAVITDNQVAEGLRYIKDLAMCFGSHVHLVHVRDKAGDSNLILHEYFTKMASIAELPKYTVTILDDDNVSDAIGRYAERVNAGIVAVMKNRPDGIFRIFSNRFSNRIIKEEGRPVFTLNLQNTD
jgi:nucleotide-binding universal stress UspA family protein